MGRTLLIGNPSTSWREWEKAHRGERDWVCLDPTDANHGIPGCFSLWRGDKPVRRRFYGSLDPQRFPLVIPVAATQLAGPDAVVQLFPYNPGPVLRHVAMLIAEALQPDEILIADGTQIDLGGWPVGPEAIDPGKALPAVVQAAQRKAHWLKLIEECGEHEVDLRQVAIEGARLGSGTPVPRDGLAKSSLPGVPYAEVCGGSLLLVCDEEPDEDSISRALGVFHCTRAHIVATTAYDDLFCGFARQDGEDFGFGLVQSVDFDACSMRVLCTAVAPAPVRLLRLGALRVDTQGRELGEVRPWQV